MDAKEYLTGMARMCKSYDDQCNGCELKEEPCDGVRADPDRLIDVVSRWVKAHPIRTRQSELLKVYPNASVDPDGVIALCPYALDATVDHCPYDYAIRDCSVCRKVYWLASIEEKEGKSDGRS